MKQVVREFRGTKKGAKASRPTGTAEKGSEGVKGNWVVKSMRRGRNGNMASNGRGKMENAVFGRN